MKNSILFLTLFLNCLLLTAQGDPEILQIRENFRTWQPIIESELDASNQLFHYVWGENYQLEGWYANKQSADKFLYQKVRLIEDQDLGTFVYYDNYSPSGDWYIAIEYYYNTSNQLYFVFWKMNTFQADEPLTIEKRLYFDSKGELIQELKSNYKMNTKEESKAGFADRDVEYEIQLNKMGFYSKWTEK